MENPVGGERSAGDLLGKTAIVTGGAMGMGFATSALLSRHGAAVVVADLDDTAGKAAAAELGPHAHFRPHDVADESSWDRLVAWTVDNFGGVDILINNAGILRTGPMLDVANCEVDHMLAVNVRGPYLGIRSLIEPMRLGGGGVIVNMSSAAGSMGVGGAVAYSATKWAVRGLTKSAALELAGDHIRVNSVHPGAVDSPMTAGRGYRRGEGNAPHIPLGRVGIPEDVAGIVLFLCTDAAAYVTGAEIAVDAGITAGRTFTSAYQAPVDQSG